MTEVGTEGGVDADGSWLLKSGIWTAKSASDGYILQRTSLGHDASSLAAVDLQGLFASRQSAAQPQVLFPPEFRFSPITGVELNPCFAATAHSWAGPFGNAAASERGFRAARGLRQSAVPLKLLAKGHSAEGSPDLNLPVPPPGDYEFVSLPLGCTAPVLLAIDPGKGTLFAYLQATSHWQSLEHETGGMLAETYIERADWRCEVASNDQIGRIFLPTGNGLACLIVDAPGSVFSASYVGGAPAAGSPIQFGDHIWAPVLTSSGLRLVSMSLAGDAGPVLDLPSNWSNLGRVHAPVADSRSAIWLSEAGQILLRKLPSGELEVRFYAWAANVKPRVEFGSPYLSRDGSFWQLCFDEATDRYVYVQLGIESMPTQHTEAPRQCTGTINYRFASKFQSEPWVEPEFGVDGSQVVIPLLEISGNESVFGLRLETTAGLEDLLQSPEPMRAVLQVDEASNVTNFHTIALTKPWRLRLFAHQGVLWLYHAQLKQIIGWKLQP